MYQTIRQAKDRYAGKYLVAVGDKQDNGQCMFVKTSDRHWEGVDVDVLASYVDTGKFYRKKGNRLKMYNTDGEAMCGKNMVSHLPLVPAGAGRQVIEREMTTWEVTMLLKSMKNETTTELKDLLDPALMWAL